MNQKLQIAFDLFTWFDLMEQPTVIETASGRRRRRLRGLFAAARGRRIVGRPAETGTCGRRPKCDSVGGTSVT